MLSDYFKSPKVQARYCSKAIETCLQGFTQWLEAYGYSRDHICGHIRNVARFIKWANGQDIALNELDKSALEQFAQHLSGKTPLRYPCGNYRRSFQSTRLFVKYASINGLNTHPKPLLTETNPETLLWQAFTDWMQSQRGTLETTIANYRLFVFQLMHDLGADPTQYTAQKLRAFLLKKTSVSHPSKAKNFTTAIRMFLRFLIARGSCMPGLDQAIPTVARWRLASLPKYISASDVNKLIDSCDLATETGVRDRAILLLLARLGLRPSDICNLRLPDLEWRNGTILVSGKNRRQTRLPLAQEVGDAIIHYLQNWRPDVPGEHVFINCSSPRISVTRHVVSKAVIRAINRTGVKAPIYGAYLLRHSAATNMLYDGLSLTSIGSIMRHSSLDTTRVYAKVDLGLLNELTMPWPGVASC